MNPSDLVDRARRVRQQAYAPYSNYPVGAAVLLADGSVFVGCNVENASYGLTVCAERSALFAMVAAGAKKPVAIAIVTEDGAAPCGACRQVLREFATDCRVYLAAPTGRLRELSLRDLLPEPFGPTTFAD